MQEVYTGLKTIYVVSENELQHVKQAGRRFRCLCPVHHSRGRDLSLAPHLEEYLDDDDAEHLAGYGHCHSAKCGATVLVQEWNPKAAGWLLGKRFTARAPRYSLDAEQVEEAEEWQRRELAALNAIYPTAQRNLKHMRCYAYLAQRGYGDSDALALLERLGVGYIPPASEWKKEPPDHLRRWCDRVIFPYTCRDGERGYTGRALFLWQPGLDENEHKKLLDAHDEEMERVHGKDAYKHQVKRWLKTYQSGFFNAEVMRKCEHLYICEGTFDALPPLLAGLPGVVAAIGGRIDVPAIKACKNVLDVTLALDADMREKESVSKAIDELERAGLEAQACFPPVDDRGKDWSERYKRVGFEGIAELISAERDRVSGATLEPAITHAPALAPAPVDAPEICSDCGAPISDESRDFFYWPGTGDTLKCYCLQCRDMETGKPRGLESRHRLLKIAQAMADAIGGAELNVHPASYTLQEHMQVLRQERQARLEARIEANRQRAKVLAG